METPIVQAQYEQLASIATSFRNQHELVLALQKSVRQTADALRHDGWKGRGEAAFFTELDNTVLPALERCHQALKAGESTIRAISQIMQAAEDDAAKLFSDSEDGNATNNLDQNLGSGKPGLASPLGFAGAESGYSPPRAHSDKEIFNDKYMDRLVGSQIRGANSKQLNQAMETLLGNPSPAERERALDQIAQARGMSREQVRAQYDQFKIYQQRAIENAKQKGEGPPEPIDLKRHPNFVGSIDNLRFGKVVGDRLGLDPVFGAMLSPTGGIVGIGNHGIPVQSEAIKYHGVMHDAGGYLQLYQNTGPGYDYLGQEQHRPKDSGFTGQESGIRYWNRKVGTGSFEEAVAEEAGTLMGMGSDVTKVYRDVKETYNKVEENVKRTAKDVNDWFSDTLGF